MIVEFGHFALILALAVALVQSTLPLWGAHRRNAALMAVAEPAAVIQFVLVAASFAALTYAFVVSDFSLLLVVQNS
nr:heme lyase NrfEFG subunit NrfE [Cypionkella sp.]